ncbi:hypothetical protein PIROE2DRAFT_60068 [Piromyces sp. E2]|nr:hypothetical protein PIROE2DRAFT_60068 [Piromyces sp. E2]|eukprot:OUM65420.1 hypothetical protein PIROE2DRAFT_60068 [Piromyces sp. E2]
MEESIPEMHIYLPESSWNTMVEKAQIIRDVNDYDVEATLKFVYKEKKQTLHGTKQFRLRSDQREASMMRSKIATDILHKSGLLAVEVGYTELYINDEYMGFWVVSDSIKNKWIERKFGDDSDNIKTLYQCKNSYLRIDDGTMRKGCVNANDKYADYMEPFHNFIDQINASTSREDLEKLMDVDNFIK